jgi:high-affinity Fe2+/Pb2+ permease
MPLARTGTRPRGNPRILISVDTGLILLVFLAFLFAWLLNKVRRFFRLSPVAYGGVMVVFVVAMLLIWGQQRG